MRAGPGPGPGARAGEDRRLSGVRKGRANLPLDGDVLDSLPTTSSNLFLHLGGSQAAAAASGRIGGT